MLLVRKLNLLFFAKKSCIFLPSYSSPRTICLFLSILGRVRAIIRKYKLAGAANVRILEVAELGVQS